MTGKRKILFLLLLLPTVCLAQTVVDTLPKPSTKLSPVSLNNDSSIVVDSVTSGSLPIEPLSVDSSALHTDIPEFMVDSLHHRRDTVFGGVQPLYLHFHPNPQTALWLSFIFPGLGQIYNRKYWKLPIVYGLGVGVGYAIAYTNGLYKDYMIGYQSYNSSSPDPSLYAKLIPKGYPESSYSSYLKNQMDSYRRYRDLSIVAAVAVYALTIVDAFVDAQLSDFDISPDLSMRVKPAFEQVNQKSAVGVGMRLNF